MLDQSILDLRKELIDIEGVVDVKVMVVGVDSIRLELQYDGSLMRDGEKLSQAEAEVSEVLSKYREKFSIIDIRTGFRFPESA